MGESGGGVWGSASEPQRPMEMMPRLVPKKKWSKRSSLDDDDFLNFLHGSDPVKIELNRLQNDLKDKDRELSEAQSEIKALKFTERAKDKALDEVTEELQKMVEKWKALEAALENKNLEIKKIMNEKKAALAAQFAAEATLRRVHAAQKDEELPSLEAILHPLEAEIKLLKQELTKLQDDNRALERQTKSKEAALLDAEREVKFANIKASLVDDLQNKNQELMKQNDICQEEYKILDKMHRLKVAEVEKLMQTVHELEEAILSGAAAANAVRDYQRQVSELKGEKRALERTLSRAMATENRVATVIANEWKDANDKVMPVKQWIEERRLLMGEMQQLREKLSIAERAAKTEAQLKERFQLRLKVLEDGLKASSRSGIRNDMQSTRIRLSRSCSVNGADYSIAGSAARRSSDFIARSSALPKPSNVLRHAKGVSRSFDGGDDGEGISTNNLSDKEIINGKRSESVATVGKDYMSGIFYDILQREVIALRKACHEKEQSLKDKDNSIEMLSRKIDTLTKAMEVETKKLRREKAAAEKEAATKRVEKEEEHKGRRLKGIVSILRS